jgi:hypothetical protein
MLAFFRDYVLDAHAFNAARTACVFDTTPTTTEPCFTASCAYSTWKIRPCGELPHVSVTVSLQALLKVNEQSYAIVIVIIAEHDDLGES